MSGKTVAAHRSSLIQNFAGGLAARLALALAAAAALALAPASLAQNTIAPDPPVADLGELKFQETGVMEVLLRNNTDKPVRFTRVVPSCTCVDGSVTQDPVAPGESATLTVTMEAIKRSGVLSKKLWVWPEGANRPVEVPVRCTIRDQGAMVDRDVEIAPKVADFGAVSPLENKTMVIELRNVGAGPVKFARASTTCGCVKARLLDDLTAPGEAARLEVTYEARPNVGPIQQEITVWRHNAVVPLKIPVRGEVTYPVRMEPFFVNLLSGAKGEILLETVNGEDFRVTSIDGAPPSDVPGNEGVSEPRPSHVVTYDFRGADPADLNPWFLIETDHPGAPILDLRMVHPALLPKADRAAAFHLSKDRFVLGQLTAGSSAMFDVDLLKLQTERDVQSVSIDDPRLEAEIVEKRLAGAKGVQLTIRVDAVNGPTGLVRANITFRAKDYEKTAPLFVRLVNGD